MKTIANKQNLIGANFAGYKKNDFKVKKLGDFPLKQETKPED